MSYELYKRDLIERLKLLDDPAIAEALNVILNMLEDLQSNISQLERKL
jgi:uncharacterized protein YjgD (DUF1641 family)